MKIIVIGSVAAGTSAAAKARRNSEKAEIVIYEKDSDISYSSCGLPYFIGSDIKREQIAPRSPEWFASRYNVQLKVKHEVLEILTHEKRVRVKDLETGKIYLDPFDKLILATGAVPFVPGFVKKEIPGVFVLRNIHSAEEIKSFIQKKQPKTALIAGSGFIGLEMAETFALNGIQTTILEAAPQVMPSMDSDMAVYLERHLEEKGVKLILGDSLEALEQDKDSSVKVSSKNKKVIKTDMVILSLGVRPNRELAAKAGIELGATGAVAVNKKMQTSIKDIYAAGDCAESYSLIHKKPLWRPLGSTANKMGRIAGDNATGGNLKFRGILGTGICRVFDLTAAQTGITEKEAHAQNLKIKVIHNIKPNQTEYFEGSSELVMKAIACKETGRLLGAQIVGKKGVDKRIDVIATAISLKAKAKALFHLDLAYAPPFSTAKDPVNYAGMIFDNDLNKGRKLITAIRMNQLIKEGKKIIVIDVREKKDFAQGHIKGAIHIPLAEIREKAKELDKSAFYVVHCNKGTSGNAAQNILLNLKFKKVYNLSGGYSQYKMTNCD